MTTAHSDILDLFDYLWKRFSDRMVGLSNDEWSWRPAADDRITLRWRIDHITTMLREDRNAAWLGLPAADPQATNVTDAATAMAAADAAFAHWRGLLTAVTPDELAAPIGAPAGRFGTATRRSFALHIVDELIHHTAEAALLRDLYAGQVAREPEKRR